MVMDYLASLFGNGLKYRTILLHRSVLSATLPTFDGFSIGNHPLVSRLVKGVFQKRPPSRRIFQPWNVGDVLNVFRAWTSPLTLQQLQRKAAFLLAIASSRRPSELSSLRFSANYLTINADFARFIPSSLSKTDRQTHLGPPILIRRLLDDSAVCPVASLEAYLSHRRSLNSSHDHVFCGFREPYEKLSASSFADRISWCLREAGITAPPGSTRATSVSDAFRRGVDISEILRAGDWSGAATFYRHYLRPQPSASTV